jgi:S1-C subfamily serine protease
VNPGSPADKCGMLEGDVILSVDGIKVSDQAELNDAKTKAKKTCKVVVKRGEKEVELTITFDE